MRLLIIRGSIILIVFLILGLLTLLLPSPKNEAGTPTSDSIGVSSFFVYGSDKKPSFQSIQPLRTENETAPVEKISLLDFLKENTSTNTEVPSVESLSKIKVAELKDYGNTVGGVIEKHSGTPESELLTFESFFEEPNNTAAKTNMETLAQTYISIGEELQVINTPDTMSQFNKEFSLAYKEVGTKMKAFIGIDFTPENIDSYGDSTTMFVDAYVNIAKLLRVYGVEFDESEPGSMFTLPF